MVAVKLVRTGSKANLRRDIVIFQTHTHKITPAHFKQSKWYMVYLFCVYHIWKQRGGWVWPPLCELPDYSDHIFI